MCIAVTWGNIYLQTKLIGHQDTVTCPRECWSWRGLEGDESCTSQCGYSAARQGGSVVRRLNEILGWWNTGYSGRIEMWYNIHLALTRPLLKECLMQLWFVIQELKWFNGNGWRDGKYTLHKETQGVLSRCLYRHNFKAAICSNSSSAVPRTNS